MKIIYDDDSGDVVVVLQEPAPDAPAYGTHQYKKFGVTMYWDGHGGLLGFCFNQEVSVPPEFIRLGWGEFVPLRDRSQQLAESGRR